MPDRKYLWPVLISLPLLYFATFGPMVWLSARGTVPSIIVRVVYWPFLCQRVHLPNSWGAVLYWYGSLGVRRGESVTFLVGDLEGDTLSSSFGSVGADENPVAEPN